MNLCKAADALGCSIDWLLGREGYPGPGDKPEPIAEETPASRSGWMTGEPEEDGRYAVLTSDITVRRLFGDICEWSNGKWWGLMEDECVRYWTPMPEE